MSDAPATGPDEAQQHITDGDSAPSAHPSPAGHAVTRILSVDHGPSLPRRIGHYRIDELLGEGRLGRVFLAQRKDEKRKVALKLIRGQVTDELSSWMKRERDNLQRVGNHRNIATYYTSGIDEGTGQPYIVMEYVDGKPITEYCRITRPEIHLEERLELFAQVCDAVHHAHSHRVIHRDISSRNVLVSRASDPAVPKVIDFGVAMMLERQVDIIDDGHAVGTTGYISPEVLEGGWKTPATLTDVYSLGALLHELVYGRLPVDPSELENQEPKRQAEIIRAHPLPKARGFAYSFGRELGWIIAKATDPDPGRRYDGPFALGEDLRRLLRREAVEALPAGGHAAYRLWVLARCHPRGSLLLLGMVGMLAVMAVVVAVLGLRTQRANSQIVKNFEELKGEKASVHAANDALESLRQTNEERELQVYAGRTRIIADLLSRGEVAQAWRLLLACPPYLRGWEWNHLCLAADSRLMKLGRSRVGFACSRAFSAENRICAGSNDGSIWGWDLAEKGRFRFTRRHHEVGVLDLAAVSGEGDAVSVAADGSLRRWNRETGAAVAQGQLLGQPLEAAFNSEGTRLAWFDGQLIHVSHLRRDGEVIRISEPTRLQTNPQAAPYRCQSEQGEFLWLAWSGEDRLVTLCRRKGERGWKGELIRWSLATGNPFGKPIELSAPGQGSRICAALDLVLVADGDGLLYLVRIGEDGPKGPVILPFTGRVWSVALSPDGRRVAAGGGIYDKTIQVWDVTPADLEREQLASTSAARVLRGHESEIGSLAFCPEHNWLVSASMDGTVGVWTMQSTSQTTRLALSHGITGRETVRTLQFSGTKANRLAAGTDLQSVVYWNLAVPQDPPVRLFAGDRERKVWQDIWDVAISQDGETVAAAVGLKSDRYAVFTWDTREKKPSERKLIETVLPIRVVAFNPIDATVSAGIAKANDDHVVRSWKRSTDGTYDPAGGQDYLGCKAPIWSIDFGSDGLRLAAGADNGTFFVWAISSSRELLTSAAPLSDAKGGQTVPIRCLRFLAATAGTAGTPAADLIVLGYRNSNIIFYDLTTGKLVHTLPSHDRRLRALAIRPGGSRMLTGSDDATVRVSEMAHRETLLELTGNSIVTDADWGPDGLTIAVGGEPGCVLLHRGPIDSDARRELIVHALRGQFEFGAQFLARLDDPKLELGRVSDDAPISAVEARVISARIGDDPSIIAEHMRRVVCSAFDSGVDWDKEVELAEYASQSWNNDPGLTMLLAAAEFRQGDPSAALKLIDHAFDVLVPRREGMIIGRAFRSAVTGYLTGGVLRAMERSSPAVAVLDEVAAARSLREREARIIGLAFFTMAASKLAPWDLKARFLERARQHLEMLEESIGQKNLQRAWSKALLDEAARAYQKARFTLRSLEAVHVAF